MVVYSDTWEQHIYQFKALLDRLVWVNLTVNLAKCEFARATVTSLGEYRTAIFQKTCIYYISTCQDLVIVEIYHHGNSITNIGSFKHS